MKNIDIFLGVLIIAALLANISSAATPIAVKTSANFVQQQTPGIIGSPNLIVPRDLTNATVIRDFDLTFQKCIGGGDEDYAEDIQRTEDGGYIVVGYTKSNDLYTNYSNHGGFDAWVIKLNSARGVEWQKCLGGSKDDFAYSVKQTADGGYIVAGSTESNDYDVWGNHGGKDAWVIKLDSNGRIEWQKCLGGSNDEEAYNIQPDTSNRWYFVAGYAASKDGDCYNNQYLGGWDAWVIKLDSNGGLYWQWLWGGSKNDYARSIICTDEVIAVAVNSYSNDKGFWNNGELDAWVFVYNSQNYSLNSINLGKSLSDEIYSIQKSSIGYIVAGSTNSPEFGAIGRHSNIGEGGVLHGQYASDGWIVELNNYLVPVWQKCYGGSFDDILVSVQQTSDNNFIVSGVADSIDGDVEGNHGGDDAWAIKIARYGNVIWSKCLGGSQDDDASSIQQTADGDIIIAGDTISNDGDVSGNHGKSDVWIVKMPG